MSTFLMWPVNYSKNNLSRKNLTCHNPYITCDIWQCFVLRGHKLKSLVAIRPGNDTNGCMLILVLFLTGFCCWLASVSELMGCKNSSWGEMGLKATKPPLVLCWDRKKQVNKHKQRHKCKYSKSACMHRLTGLSQHCGPSWAASGCWTECPQGGWRHPDAWTLSYSSDMRETNQTQVIKNHDNLNLKCRMSVSPLWQWE